MTEEIGRLRRLVENWRPIDVLVVGDAMLDVYVHGAVTRVSPEAPVPVLEEQRRDARPGGAAHLAASLSALGARVRLLARCAEDEAGETLRRLVARAGVEASWLPVGSTTVKTRFVSLNQQLLRVDLDHRTPLGAGARDALLRGLASHSESVVVSDYGQGLVDTALLTALRARDSGWYADPSRHRPAGFYAGARLLTPNRNEAHAGLGGAKGGVDPRRLAERYASAAGGSPVLLTLGAEGGVLWDGTAHVLPVRARPVFDVTGAGDTTLAAAVRAHLSGANLVDAARLGMVAGGLAVTHFGARPVGVDELIADLS